VNEESLDGKCCTVSFPCEAVGEMTAEECLEHYGGNYFHEFGMGGVGFDIVIIVVDGLGIGIRIRY